MSKLFFFGDSITAGALDGEFGGWVNRVITKIIKEEFEREIGARAFYCNSYNLGVHGDFVKDVVKRLPNEIEARSKPEDEIQIVFAAGVKDTLISDEFEFSNNLKIMISKALEFTKNISFIGLFPVDEARTKNPYKNDKIKSFNNAVRNTCEEYEIPFCSLFEKAIARGDYKAMLHDGLHPNGEGHRFIYEIVAPFIINDEFYNFHSMK